MKLRRLLSLALFSIAAIALSGCASGPPTAPNGGALSDSDYGEPPNNVDDLIAAYLRDKLKDPYSAQIERVAGPGRTYQKASLLGPSTYGWGICFRVNAKNSFGGYTGFRTHVIVFRNGSIVRSHGTMSGSMFGDTLAQGMCESIQ
jgi:hypothetical protein